MVGKVAIVLFIAALSASVLAQSSAGSRSLSFRTSGVELLSREVIFGSAGARPHRRLLNRPHTQFNCRYIFQDCKNVGTIGITLLAGGRCTGGTARALPGNSHRREPYWASLRG